MSRYVRSIFVLIAATMAHSHAYTQENEPARGLAAIRVPEGFTVEIAASPDLSSYPMFMAFDETGRLFIAESSGKNISGKAMAAEPECLILLLEDTNQDGVYDTKTVFADKLSLPMGVLWYQGSLYVASPPDFIRLDDNNRDGVSDHREYILTGWNILNTASLHGPFLGPDGWMYLTHGRHGYKIPTKEGTTLEGLASRIWRCKPDGAQLERLAGGGFDNPVELIFTEAGETIGTMTYFTDPKNGQRDALMHFVEGGVYPKFHDSTAEFTRTGDLMPTMTKFARIAPAGLMRYRGDQFGPEYRGNLFSAQFNPHRVQRHKLARNGATYVTEDEDFLTSIDPDFHPTDVLEDADGSMLVSDTGGWYVDACPISRVAKPEVRGSIYRVRRTGTVSHADPWGKKERLHRKSASQLVLYLSDPRPLLRDHAVELLVAQAGKAVGPLARVLTSPAPLHARVHALWALGRIDNDAALDAVREALADASPEIRIAAARIAGLKRDRESVPQLRKLLTGDDLAVRRQAATALGYIGDVSSANAVLDACVGVTDRFLEHALVYTLIQLADAQVLRGGLVSGDPAVRKAALIALDQIKDSPLQPADFEPFLSETDPALRSTVLWIASRHPEWSDLVLKYVEEGIRSPEFVRDAAGPIQDVMLAYAGDAAVQQMIASLIVEESVDVARKLFLLDTMNGSNVKEFPEAWVKSLEILLASNDDVLRDRAIFILRSRNIGAFDDRLRKVANDASEPVELRLSALSTVIARTPALDDSEFAFVCEQLKPESGPATRQTASKILVSAELTVDQLVQLANAQLPNSDALTFPSLLDAFRGASAEKAGLALVNALSQASDHLNLVPSQTVDDLLGQFPDKVRDAAAPLRAKAEAERAARIERLSKLEPLLGTGDVGRGRRIFYGEKVGCYTCHAVGAEGGDLGPDLTTIGAVRSGHDLLEALLFPSASIVPDYETYLVETEWESHSGTMGRQTADSITLKLAVNSEVEIPRPDIRSMTQHPVSKMPEGLDLALSQQELLDLMAFLQSLNNEQWLLPERRETASR